MQSVTQVFERIQEIRETIQKMFPHPQKLKSADTQTPKPAVLVQAPAAPGKPGRFNEIIAQASEKYQLPQSLLNAVIKRESNYEADAVAHKGAMGLMQLMPETARELNVSEPFSPKQNIMGGAAYLRQMLDLFDGDLVKALAAYNAGPQKMGRGQVPKIPETQEYVKKVIESYLENSGVKS